MKLKLKDPAGFTNNRGKIWVNWKWIYRNIINNKKSGSSWDLCTYEESSNNLRKRQPYGLGSKVRSRQEPLMFMEYGGVERYTRSSFNLHKAHSYLSIKVPALRSIHVLIYGMRRMMARFLFLKRIRTFGVERTKINNEK
ncbi:hypothetical protein RB195_021158 [Necator americanus]|uniref:Uncharacterized protein n=1 Tax=Necator americanus TaxID=51031 RepID=A0ABR1EA20_NECAM